MFRRLTLAQKSSIVIGMLLAFEFILLAFLYKSLNEAEKDVIKEFHGRNVALEATTVQSLSAQAATSLLLYRSTKQPSFLNAYDHHLMRIANKFRTIRQMLSLYPDDQPALRKLDQAERSLNRLTDLATRRHNVLGIVQKRDEMLKECNDVMDGIAALETTQFASASSSIANSRIRDNVRSAVVVGAVLNLIVGALLVLVFNRGVTKRLAIIKDNTRRLSANQSLNLRDIGQDEIAEVDASFHEMAGRLKELDQLKRTFFASVSHDIRSPLNSIQAVHTILLNTDMIPLPEAAVKRLKAASNCCERIVEIVSNLLDYEKIELGHIELVCTFVSARQIVHESVENLQGLIDEKNLQVECHVPEIDLLADPDWSVQLLTNILSNAIKFAPADSQIRISAKSECQRFLEICVSDQGPGIAETDQKLIFEQFKQLPGAQRRKDSTGLGLAICKKIAEEHGGTIGVRSVLREGSEFWFTLPIYSEGTSVAQTVESTGIHAHE
jgi:signal transduction histidine kinase